MSKDKFRVTPNKFGEGHSVEYLALPTKRASFAIEMIQRLALIAAKIDGEDSAGRARLIELTPDEVVQRACDIAQKAWDEFEKRGWIVDIPEK